MLLNTLNNITLIVIVIVYLITITEFFCVRVNAKMNNSHALANTIGASVDIILTSSSAFMIFLILANERMCSRSHFFLVL